MVTSVPVSVGVRKWVGALEQGEVVRVGEEDPLVRPSAARLDQAGHRLGQDELPLPGELQLRREREWAQGQLRSRVNEATTSVQGEPRIPSPASDVDHTRLVPERVPEAALSD